MSRLILVSIGLALAFEGHHAHAADPSPPDFRTEISALLSRTGCNSGSCHGAFNGQNGFRLSLFGHEPDEDFLRITREASGRRVNLANPRHSLLLLKATGRIPHQGGKRFGEGSPAYQRLLRWIEAGSPPSPPQAPGLAELRVSPREILLSPGGRARLRVTAHFDNGTSNDVTDLALFASRDEGVARVDPDGLATALRPGDTFATVSYLGRFSPCQVFVPHPAPRVDPGKGWRSSNYLDEHALTRWRKLNLAPAALCDDASFLRRVSLDLCGTLPDPVEVREFARSTDPERRRKKIDELLARPEYAMWWATRLSDLTGNDNRYLGFHNWKLAFGWWSWLRVRLERNEPYDEVVRNILVATSREGRSYAELARWMAEERPRMDDRTRWDLRYQDRTTLDAFWSKVNNRAPEVVIQEISHAFLGLRLDCAQCHKHPFDRWTQDDFWSLAAFVSRVKLGYTREAHATTKPGQRPPFKEVFVASKADDLAPVRHPKTQAVMVPRLLGGPACPDEDGTDPRQALARWVTSPDNPYFARALVNRVFASHLGRGLVEPTDAFSAANPPSNPALLDALAADFVAHRFDLKHLHRTILNSRLYQLDHRPAPGQPLASQTHTSYTVKRLPAEVLIDALDRVTGAPPDVKDILVPPGTRAIAYPLSRSSGRIRYAFRIFGRPLRAEICDCERDSSPSLPQSLYLLNDMEVLARIRAPGGRLARLLGSGKADREVVEEFYLAALSRPPSKAEESSALRHLTEWQRQGTPAKGSTLRREAFEDLVWALLNLKEFQTNH